MGAFVSLAQYGNAHMDISGMQLQWDYSAEGLSNPGAVEVRVFAVEMVYIPQGDFNLFKNFGGTTIIAPGDNFGVINTRLTPVLTYSGGACRVKGDAGLDSNADGNVDNPDYPTGYTAFYAFKYEMSEQQYADFLNCLTGNQISSLGVAGSSITLNNGVYFASAPNRACNGFNNIRALAYADWAGLRPLSILEYAKASLGSFSASSNTYPLGGYFGYTLPRDVGFGDSGNSSKSASGSGYYGMKDMGGNVAEAFVNVSSSNFSRLRHGDGNLHTNGNSNEANWSEINMLFFEPNPPSIIFDPTRGQGFRFARTAE
jgi:formylglycine-generating enzyme required for sulfatase activity